MSREVKHRVMFRQHMTPRVFTGPMRHRLDDVVDGWAVKNEQSCSVTEGGRNRIEGPWLFLYPHSQ